MSVMFLSATTSITTGSGPITTPGNDFSYVYVFILYVLYYVGILDLWQQNSGLPGVLWVLFA